jgi:hypothetical protein
MLIEAVVDCALTNNRDRFATLCADTPSACAQYPDLLRDLLGKLACATELTVSHELPRTRASYAAMAR